MSRIPLVLILGAFVALGTVWAEEPTHSDAEKSEWASCTICKHMAPHMEELMPVMKRETIRMNDGLAMLHWVTDDSKVELFHEIGAKMNESGEATAEWTAEQAEKDLCHYCFDMWEVIAAGARYSQGQTKNGDIMVLTSDDPDVQAKLFELHEKAVKEMGT
jgi:hypothetical protein